MELERHAGEEVNNDKIIILGLSIPLSGINRDLFQKDVRLISYFFIDWQHYIYIYIYVYTHTHTHTHFLPHI